MKMAHAGGVMMRCDRHALARRTPIPGWGDGRGAITLPPSRGGCSSPEHYICVAMSRMAAAFLELLHLRKRICCLIAFASMPLLRLTRFVFRPQFLSLVRKCSFPLRLLDATLRSISQVSPRLFLSRSSARASRHLACDRWCSRTAAWPASA
jgi:hypothetical protein